MALSDYERKMLEELEAQLASDDPRFAQSMKPQVRPQVELPSFQLSLRHVVLGLLVSVLGIAILVGGIAMEQILVAVVGVLVLFAGFWYISEGIKRGKTPQGRAHHSPSASPSAFMQRQMEAWERRRDQRP